MMNAAPKRIILLKAKLARGRECQKVFLKPVNKQVTYDDAEDEHEYFFHP